MPRIALFVDSLDHVSGVSNAISQWRRGAAQRGHTLEVLCTARSQPFVGAVHFPEQRVVRLRAYEGLELKMPNGRIVGDYLHKGGFNICHICTPGPMGLLGMSAARELGLPVCGTYHTDFPRYVRHLIGPLAERPMSRFMRRFYGRMDRIIAPSQATVDRLADDGFDMSRIRIVGRGVDPNCFSPAHRDASLPAQWGLKGKTLLLYVGRVSHEKNLECLAEAFKALRAERNNVGLVVVGDGPYAADMAAELKGTAAHFAGFQTGDDLSRIYASCDLFVFPSLTDTFGNVVLEAQASGLPVIVSDAGGPKHAMSPGETGVVVDSMTPERLKDAVAHLLADRRGMASRAKRAREFALTRTRDACFEAFWNIHCECLAGRA